MVVIKAICIVLGIAFIIFGYLIRFKKKYNLINGFMSDLKDGRKSESYAQRVGLIEFVIGIILLTAGAAMLLFV